MQLNNFLCPEGNLLNQYSPGIYLLLLQDSWVTKSNVTNHSIMETGFVVGTDPSDMSYVNFGFDSDLPFQVPVINGSWRAPLQAKAVILVRKGTNLVPISVLETFNGEDFNQSILLR
ncbi:hypothetical protein LEP1GSC202_3726 [Leptospira yanagawae serovar Saopaulo str. Sao Paulo = ATCC 700523]|uniref:Uncharacterized protein n=2 Tax=Leptospira yanagawae TaxID=293069 RepID=A0A5E8HLH0_9LEPT|nr:hypothetical protein LEP1GSC202_3726 [Leptospira yanagawae serovar Saopaulo str. Sao Paulo = ATCC 700523]